MATTHRSGGSQPDSRPQPATSCGQAVLIVGVCAGHRCAALRRLEGTDAHVPTVAPAVERDPATTSSERLVRKAVHDRHEAVLVSLPCLGPCHQASVAALGPGLAGANRLTWLGRPTLFGVTQLRERAHALADWIVSGAPNPRTLPPLLRRDSQA